MHEGQVVYDLIDNISFAAKHRLERRDDGNSIPKRQVLKTDTFNERFITPTYFKVKMSVINPSQESVSISW